MKSVIASPIKSLTLGLLLSALILAIWIVVSRVDGVGFVSFLLRWVHIVAAIVWIGMIWFVNFIQLVAVAEAEPAERSAIMKHIVPRVAFTFRHASHLTVASGVLLLLASGYLFDSLVFSSPVYVPPVRNLMLWGGTLAALAMYAFAHMVIWPGLRIVLGQEPADADKVAAARARVLVYARWNLILALPVTMAMVAAAHLY